MQIFLHFHKKDSHFCDKKLFAPKITCPKSVPVYFKFDMYTVGLRGIRTWEMYFVAENATTHPQWLLCLVQLLHIYIFFTTYLGQEWCGFESPCHQYMKVKVVHKWNTLLAPNPFPSMNPTQPIPSHLIFWLYTYEPVIACLYYGHHSTPYFSLWFISFLVAFQNSQHTKRDRFFCQKKYQNPCRALYQSSTDFPLTGGTSTFTPS